MVVFLIFIQIPIEHSVRNSEYSDQTPHYVSICVCTVCLCLSKRTLDLYELLLVTSIVIEWRVFARNVEYLTKISQSIIRIGLKSPLIIRMGQKSQSIIRIGQKSPLIVRMGQKSPLIVRMGQKSPLVVRMGQKSPLTIRMGQKSQSIIRIGQKRTIV